LNFKEACEIPYGIKAKSIFGSIVLYCIYFGPRNPEDIGQVNVQQYKPQNN
jgi:hypothetical protein